ncbi:ATP synthase subunit I [Proteocatella sphenisci]|uniref:ATP synthase subunit I n=1 Tax=Proteocatella sphenisci TaxID=181070 RepID=UPI00048E0C3B|nr:ATP synthase subunit I [Proteocatella sphenisci]
MDELFVTKLKVVKNAIFLMAAVMVASLVFFDNWTAFITGLVFGLLISILCFELLSGSIVKAVSLPPEKAQIFAGSRYFIRLVIYAVVILISIKADYINVIGTILGLSSIKMSIVISAILSNFK